MTAHIIGGQDGGTAGEAWAENFDRLPGGAGVSLILESTPDARRRTTWLE